MITVTSGTTRSMAVGSSSKRPITGLAVGTAKGMVTGVKLTAESTVTPKFRIPSGTVIGSKEISNPPPTTVTEGKERLIASAARETLTEVSSVSTGTDSGIVTGVGFADKSGGV